MRNVHTHRAAGWALSGCLLVSVVATSTAWARTADANAPIDPNAPSDANAPVATSQPASAETPPPLLFREDAEDVSPTDGPDMLSRMTVSIVLVGVLGVIAWIAVKKFGPRVGLRSGRTVRVVETVYLGPKKALHLVDINGQRLLLGSTAENVSMLSHLQAADDGAETFRLPVAEDGEPASPDDGGAE